jgi:hypothetical protein
LRAISDDARRNKGLQGLHTRIAEQQARANELWSSGDGGMQRRVVATGSGEETEEEGKTKTIAMDIYIEGTGRREGDTRNGPAMLKQLLAIAGVPGSRSKVTYLRKCHWIIFTNYSQFF